MAAVRLERGDCRLSATLVPRRGVARPRDITFGLSATLAPSAVVLLLLELTTAVGGVS